MNRQEPYIGMPIILASFDDEPSAPQNQQMHHNHQMPQNQQMPSGTAVYTETRQPMVLAMAYVPWQRWQETYPLDEGLNKGTIFPELYLPFEGKRWGGMRK